MVDNIDPELLMQGLQAAKQRVASNNPFLQGAETFQQTAAQSTPRNMDWKQALVYNLASNLIGGAAQGYGAKQAQDEYSNFARNLVGGGDFSTTQDQSLRELGQNIRLVSEARQQQAQAQQESAMNSALFKEGKRLNPVTKQIEFLPGALETEKQSARTKLLAENPGLEEYLTGQRGPGSAESVAQPIAAPSEGVAAPQGVSIAEQKTPGNTLKDLKKRAYELGITSDKDATQYAINQQQEQERQGFQKEMKQGDTARMVTGDYRREIESLGKPYYAALPQFETIKELVKRDDVASTPALIKAAAKIQDEGVVQSGEYATVIQNAQSLPESIKQELISKLKGGSPLSARAKQALLEISAQAVANKAAILNQEGEARRELAKRQGIDPDLVFSPIAMDRFKVATKKEEEAAPVTKLSDLNTGKVVIGPDGKKYRMR